MPPGMGLLPGPLAGVSGRHQGVQLAVIAGQCAEPEHLQGSGRDGIGILGPCYRVNGP